MNTLRNSLARRATEYRPEPEPEKPGFAALTPERARALLFIAARPAAFALSVLAVAVFLTLLAASSGYEGLTGAVAGGWLAGHQVPLSIEATTLGALPLLPTLLIGAMTARECTREVTDADDRVDLAWVAGAAVGGPLLVTAVCLAVVADASETLALRPPQPLLAFSWVGGVHLLAAGIGIAVALRRQLIARIPYTFSAAGYLAGHTMARLLGCGLLLTLIALCLQWSRVSASFSHAQGAAGITGLIVLSILYVPNLVLLTLALTTGVDVEVGSASIGVFAVVDGARPELPIVAALPAGPAAWWWPVLLVLPAAVGVIAGLDAARISEDRLTAPWTTFAGAALAAMGLVGLAAVAGGALGSMGALTVPMALFAGILTLWLATAGYLGLVCGRMLLTPTPIVPAWYADIDADDPPEFTDEFFDDPYFDDLAEEDPTAPDIAVEMEAEVVDETLAVESADARPTPAEDVIDAEVVDPEHP